MNALRALVLTMSLVLLSGCAASGKTELLSEEGIYDPYEDFNRAVFAFNQGVDTVILEPVTIVYRGVVPAAGRTGVSNVLSNLKSPVYLANEMMQGDWEDAGLVIKRFLINTFTGFGGLLDTASWEGIDYVPEDFGQTLYHWGMKESPYLVLPFFGPSTVRDSIGIGGDMVMDPLWWYVHNTDRDGFGITRTAATVLTVKDQTMDSYNDLERNSFDPYAALRSVYFQRRGALVKDLDPDSVTSIDIPDYDE